MSIFIKISTLFDNFSVLMKDLRTHCACIVSTLLVTALDFVDWQKGGKRSANKDKK